MVLGGDDNTVKLWDPASGIVQTMDEHTKLVRAVAVLPDGRVVSGSDDNTAKLWDPTTGTVQTMVEQVEPRGWVLAVAVLPDGCVVSGSADHKLKLWDPVAGIVQTMDEHTKLVRAVAVLPDGRVVATSGNQLHWYRVHQADFECLGSKNFRNRVRYVAVSASFGLASANDSKSVCVWSDHSRYQLPQPIPYFVPAPVTAIAWHPRNRGSLPLSPTGNCSVLLWNLISPSEA